MTLTEFLLARIAEDKAAARQCAVVYPSPWDVYDRGHSACVMADEPHFHHVVDLDQRQAPDAAWLGDAVQHVARWDPARVLAECDAKRRIVDLHSDQHDEGTQGWEEPYVGCPTLRLLALPYADHPDYDQAWRP